ncbi:unnamed protein product [Trichobilharzia regenti]|nr:unnamed protein product [Trichobilharzia regenti]
MYTERHLNKKQRLNEVKRITQDNEELAKKLKNCKNVYKREDWENDWAKALNYMTNISKFGMNSQRCETFESSNDKKENKSPNKSMDLIKPFVDSVIETALNEVQHVDVNRLKIDTNDPSFKSDPLYCETMRNLKDSVPDEPPVSVRGLVASIIQSSLYRVYEKDLLDNRQK